VTQLDVLVADTLHEVHRDTARDLHVCTNAHDNSEDICMDDAQLADGSYDAFIVWADARDDGNVAFDLTFTTGAHKGDVVTVLARSSKDPIALVGLPCTLVVDDGHPRIDLS
jgi:hypothetical protein